MQEEKMISMLLVLLINTSLACSSNCYSCHNIPSDGFHDVLKTCTDCHPEHRGSDIGKCGADCFECHPVDRVISSSPKHRVLGECIDCHKKLRESDLYRSLIGG